MSRQVDKEHYDFSKYCNTSRFISYWHQLDEIIKLNPQSVLEVGVGDKVVASYLKNNTDIVYTSLDIAEDLKPDIVGDIEKMDLADNSFDIICAFEVLEHLQFDDFDKTLRELSRVSKNYVVLSLPHWGRHFSIEIRLPFLGKIKWQYKFNFLPIKHKFNGQHYWEIGKAGYSINKIRSKIQEAGLNIEKDYVSFGSPYHHFFILKKKINVWNKWI
ncbi:MAG: methyltransferase domain-containing protein [Patescibacteria group bacterium]|jgi:ubiquinone/menaquinone biosynthesis C-methylase UbiE